MSEKTVSSAMLCGHLCQLMQNCSGFNHKPRKEVKEGNCKLFSGDVESVQLGDDESEWNFYKSIKEKVFTKMN